MAKTKRKPAKKKKVKQSLTNIRGVGATLKGSKSKAMRTVAARKLSKYGWKVKPKRKHPKKK